MKLKLGKFNFDQLKMRWREFVSKNFQNHEQKLLKEYLELLEERPDDLALKQKLAELYYKTGQSDQAIDCLRFIAEAQEKKDFTLKAIKTYRRILKIAPHLIEINMRIAQLAIKADQLSEASNQFRIAIGFFARKGDIKQAIKLSEELVKIDPSPANRVKLAEIYQSYNMIDEAVKQYEALAKDYRSQKNFDKLLEVYEMILPHRPQNTAIIKDVCILYLRKQEPARALKIMEKFKVTENEVFQNLAEKAKLMMEAIKRHKQVV